MSRRPYECYYCRDHGFPNTMVYLAGKDDSGKTIQLEEDGTKHLHKTKGQQTQEQQGTSTVVTTSSPTLTNAEPTSIKIINTKLDRIISLLESQHQSKVVN